MSESAREGRWEVRGWKRVSESAEEEENLAHSNSENVYYYCTERQPTEEYEIKCK